MAIVDINTASGLLGAEPQEVRYLASHGRLPARSIGGEWYFSDSNIDTYVEVVESYRRRYGEQAPEPAGTEQ